MATKDTVKHLFSHTVKGIIWKIILDDAKQIMVFESRTTDKKVYFYAYDFLNNKFLFVDKTFEEKWHLGILAVFNGILYLHGYENEHSPSHKQIIAYNLFKEEILWENYTHSAENIYTEGIVAFNPKVTPKRLELFDKDTGQLIKALNYNDLSLLTPLLNDIQLPSDNFNTELWNSTQTLNYQHLTLKSFYQQEENTVNHYINIHQNGNLIFTDFLNNNIQKLMHDTFFVWSKKLVYIRNKSEIVSYLL